MSVSYFSEDKMKIKPTFSSFFSLYAFSIHTTGQMKRVRKMPIFVVTTKKITPATMEATHHWIPAGG